MTDRELKLKLKNLRGIRSAVLPNALWRTETRKMLMARVKEDMVAVAPSQMIAPIVLPRTALNRFMFVLRPVVATCMVAGLAVMGWAAGVSSSFVSKPGDLLYGLQNAAEQTQLTFAADPAARAYLHLELAGRRANEVAVLAESNGVNRDSDMLAAISQLQKEITSVNQNLNEVNASNSVDTAAVAKAVDRKVAEIHAVFSKTKNLLSASVQQKADAVQAAADDVSLQAVAVLVADAKTPEAKSDAATRVAEKIDNAEASIAVASTEAADQAKEALKQAKAALASDNLAQAVAKVQESADLTNADAASSVEAKQNRGETSPGFATEVSPHAEVSPLVNANTPPKADQPQAENTGKIKAIGF